VIREVQEETGLTIRSPQLCGIKDWCENQCRFVVLLYKATCFDGELRSSPEGRVWLEDIADLPLSCLLICVICFGFSQKKL